MTSFQVTVSPVVNAITVSDSAPSVSINGVVTTATGSAGGDLSGSYPSPVVDGIQGRAVASTAPTNGQALAWNNSTQQWEPTSISVGSGTVTSITAGTGLTGGTITTSGKIAVDFGAGATQAAPGNHTHAISGVSGLQTALDAKLDDSQASVTGLSILGAADAAAVRSTLGLATTDTPVFAAVEFANGERIRNSTNGRVDIVPQPTGSSRHGIYFDMVAVGGQLNIGTVRSTDGALNIGKIVFDATLGVGTLDFAPGVIQETVGDLTLESVGGSVYLFGASVFINSYSIPGTIGTVGQVLTSNGTNAVWQTPSGGGISEEDAIAFAAAL
ncbi:MAG: hypothetical protein ACK5PR_00505 [bacterium]